MTLRDGTWPAYGGISDSLPGMGDCLYDQYKSLGERLLYHGIISSSEALVVRRVKSRIYFSRDENVGNKNNREIR